MSEPRCEKHDMVLRDCADCSPRPGVTEWWKPAERRLAQGRGPVTMPFAQAKIAAAYEQFTSQLKDEGWTETEPGVFTSPAGVRPQVTVSDDGQQIAMPPMTLTGAASKWAGLQGEMQAAADSEDAAMGPWITSAYGGQCGTCGDRFDPGDLIRKDEDEDCWISTCCSVAP